LWRALIRILVLILVLRRIGRGNLSILGIGWRSGLTPITLLPRRRSLLRGLLLGRRNQSRSQRQARAQSSRKHPLQTISIHIHF
jgi:hypothetical protein